MFATWEFFPVISNVHPLPASHGPVATPTPVSHVCLTLEFLLPLLLVTPLLMQELHKALAVTGAGQDGAALRAAAVGLD